MSWFKRLNLELPTVDGNKKSLVQPLLLLTVVVIVLVGLLLYKKPDLIARTRFSPPPLPATSLPSPDPAIVQTTPAAVQPNEQALPEAIRQDLLENAIELTQLRASEELLGVRLSIAKMNRELDALSMSPGPALASFPPTTGMPEVPVSFAAPPSAFPHFPQVRSIRGLDGRLTAVLSTGGAVSVVKVGDRLQNGTIERISLNGVEFRTSDGALYPLSFED